MSVAASDPIIVGNISLSFHRAAAGVTRRVLESRGHRVKSVEAKHEELFDLLRNGDVELHVGNDGIEEIDTLINVSGMSPLRAADRYLADHHPEVLL